MANVTINTSGNPWVITSGGATALPATVIGVQNTGNQAFPFMPTRIVWVSPSAGAGDQVILQDIPGAGGAGTSRDIAKFVANGADYMPPQEWKPSGHAAYFVGLKITQFDSGELHIFL